MKKRRLEGSNARPNPCKNFKLNTDRSNHQVSPSIKTPEATILSKRHSKRHNSQSDTTLKATQHSKRHNSQSDTTLKATRLSKQQNSQSNKTLKATKLSKQRNSQSNKTLKELLTLVPNSAIKDER